MLLCFILFLHFLSLCFHSSSLSFLHRSTFSFFFYCLLSFCSGSSSLSLFNFALFQPFFSPCYFLLIVLSSLFSHLPSFFLFLFLSFSPFKSILSFFFPFFSLNSRLLYSSVFYCPLCSFLTPHRILFFISFLFLSSFHFYLLSPFPSLHFLLSNVLRNSFLSFFLIFAFFALLYLFFFFPTSFPLFFIPFAFLYFFFSPSLFLFLFCPADFLRSFCSFLLSSFLSLFSSFFFIHLLHTFFFLFFLLPFTFLHFLLSYTVFTHSSFLSLFFSSSFFPFFSSHILLPSFSSIHFLFPYPFFFIPRSFSRFLIPFSCLLPLFHLTPPYSSKHLRSFFFLPFISHLCLYSFSPSSFFFSFFHLSHYLSFSSLLSPNCLES